MHWLSFADYERTAGDVDGELRQKAARTTVFHWLRYGLPSILVGATLALGASVMVALVGLLQAATGLTVSATVFQWVVFGGGLVVALPLLSAGYRHFPILVLPHVSRLDAAAQRRASLLCLGLLCGGVGGGVALMPLLAPLGAVGIALGVGSGVGGVLGSGCAVDYYVKHNWQEKMVVPDGE